MSTAKREQYKCTQCKRWCNPDDNHLCVNCSFNYQPQETIGADVAAKMKSILPHNNDLAFLSPENNKSQSDKVREFSTGATRDTNTGKYDYEGFLSPLVINAFAEYMHANRLQSDGKLRDSDNWQKGIPLDAYMKSGWRHFMDWWMLHRGHASTRPETDQVQTEEEALCGLLFNVQGYLHELLSNRDSEE